eukprot:TRINITY_DN32663_c0_g1_i1.p1 TRINITY_DN32663_c0_g1~~TRINITY_DN32663_c0_g1_i1.p1  ORF type:complete len:374 (+),score=65.80 TRINITY_DN32663_c0_g1_i1:239-1360(+)
MNLLGPDDMDLDEPSSLGNMVARDRCVRQVARRRCVAGPRVLSCMPRCRRSAWCEIRRDTQHRSPKLTLDGCNFDDATSKTPDFTGGRSTAIVVRVHGGTTDAMFSRHLAWAAELFAESSPSLPISKPALCILVDETFSEAGEIQRRVERLADAAGINTQAFSIYPYTEEDMLMQFPSLEVIRASLPKSQAVQDCFRLPGPKSMAWCFHVESLLVWWLQLQRTDRPGFVWVIEDDAGLSGSLLQFVGAYREEHADLITHGLQAVEDSWIWRDAASSKFLCLPRLERLRCAEHLQRFSSALFDALAGFSQQEVTGWSEMSVPTLCKSAGLVCVPIRAEHVGRVFRFDGKVPAAVWPHLCENQQTKNRWWHALKW